MKRINLKDIIISEKSSIKEAMRIIDRVGLRLAYVVNDEKKLVGVVSDSEIRGAILKGKDIRDHVNKIMNPKPVVLKENHLSNRYAAKRIIKRLLDKMPDSQYIVVLNKREQPKKFVFISDLTSDKRAKKDKKNICRNVLVVGGSGYLGSVLVRKLLSRGFKVKVLDTLLFGIYSIENLLANDRFTFIQGDMRNISTLVKALEDVDAVINLAAIVGDPACKYLPEAAIETNYLANKALAEACKYHQINRFIYASTCSVYGMMNEHKRLVENSPLNPISLYARSKIQSEEGILALEDENFSPTILRMSTLYGYSPRMRFDLVVNAMTKTATVNKKIYVYGNGRQWRPFLHVDDAAEAYIKCLEAPLDKIKGEIFNVGSDKQNFRIVEIAETVNECVPDASLVMKEEKTDLRDYFVSFYKIEKMLKFISMNKLGKSILRIKKAIEDKEIKDVENPIYYNSEPNK